MKSKVLQEKIAASLDEVQAINNVIDGENRDPKAEESARIAELIGEDGNGGIVANLKKQLAQATAFERELASVQASRQIPAVHESKSVLDASNLFARIRVPAKATARAPITAFQGEFAAQAAYGFGKLVMAVAGNKSAGQWCQDSLGIDVQNAMSGGSDSDGGFLIPTEYEANLIRLVNEYGVIRRSAEIVPMSRDVKDTPRRTAGITGYWIGETGTPTETTPTLDMVKLVAKKLGALSYYSRDVDEDSAIAVGNLITQEMALAMAYNEDNAGFNGDGTSTYGGIVGIKNALAAGAKYTAIAGNLGFQKLDLEDFEGMIAELPSYAFMNGGPSWYIHRSGWALSMLRLAAAAGGNTTREIAGGASQVQFLGYPVVFVEVMNNTTGDQASTDGLVYFGNLRQGVKFGDRRGVTVDLSREVKFLTQQIAILGTERFDIKVHETGTASVAGSIVMLSTPGS
jgi:HK97 family phage major capsid protein